jgi:hypothetical protein
MFSKTQIALFAAIVVLGVGFPASAAPKHHRVSDVHPTFRDILPADSRCSPIHPPLCSNICSESGPCAPPDHW